MIYILAFIVLIGVIVFVHELGHYLAARSVGVTVEQFSIGMPPTVYNYKPKNSDTVFSIGALPLGGYVKMKGILDENMNSSFTGADDELESKTPLQKIWVMSAGVIMNLILTFFVFILIGNIEGDTELENNNTVIDYVVPEQSAENSGVLAGDKIISINSIEVDSWKTAVENIEKNPNKSVLITIDRNGELISFTTKLGSRPNLSTGRVDQEVGTLGVSKKQIPVQLNFQESIIYGYNQTKWAMTLMTSSLKMIFQGKVSRDEVGSVIMIGDMAGQAAQAGLVPFLFLMALISVNLAYINILPIPGLDGGHIALILIEVLMGRKLSVKARIRIQSFGMFILLTLMVFLILNDIIRVFF